MADAPPGDVTRVLANAAAGDEAAVRQLVPLVYDELRALAGRYLGRGRDGHTLQPTALVHEAFLRLVRADPARWQSRAHFQAIAATAMRQILADHARRRHAAKRGGGWQRVTLTEMGTPQGPEPIDLIALDEALVALTEVAPRQARVVELRVLGGLTVPETAEVLGLSTRTIEQEWRRARAWLSRELGRDDGA